MSSAKPKLRTLTRRLKLPLRHNYQQLTHTTTLDTIILAMITPTTMARARLSIAEMPRRMMTMTTERKWMLKAWKIRTLS